jgi:hypothetical protein
MNGTAIANRLQNSFKIKDNNVYGSCIIEILGLRPSNRLPVSYYCQILVNIVDAIIKGHYKSLTMKNEKS